MEVFSFLANCILVMVTIVYVVITYKQLKSNKLISKETIATNRITTCFSKIKFIKSSQYCELSPNEGSKDYGKILVKENFTLESTDESKYLRFIFQIYDKNEMSLQSAKISKLVIENTWNGKIYKNIFEYNECDQDFISLESTKNEEIETFYMPAIIKSDDVDIQNIAKSDSLRITLTLFTRNSFNVVSSGEYIIVLYKSRFNSDVEDWENMYDIVNDYYHYGVIEYNE